MQHVESNCIKTTTSTNICGGHQPKSRAPNHELVTGTPTVLPAKRAELICLAKPTFETQTFFTENTPKNIKNQKKTNKNIKNPKNIVKKSSFIAVNIRGLVPGLRRDKMTFIQELADEMKSDYIIITETHLRKEQDESESKLRGWIETRSDRNQRSHGGVITYTRDYIALSDQLSFSNGHVDLACCFLSQDNTAIVNFYRPPDCPTKLFLEAIEKVEDWMKALELKLGKVPNIVFSGDFNLPDLKSWSQEDCIKASANLKARIENNAKIGIEREQVAKMIEVMEKNAFSQEIKTPTREGNILDLVFCNNDDYIENIETIENVAMSDHKFIIAHLTKENEVHREASKKNFCSTVVPEYNLKVATTEEWQRARETFKNKSEEFNLDASANEIVNEVIKTLEYTVTECFDKTKVPDRTESRSKSLIPRQARTLMKRKLNTSKTLQKTNDPEKIQALKDKIFEIEEELRRLVHKRRSDTEKKARNNLRNDPNPLYKLVKKLSRKPTKVGPLKRNKVNKDWTEAEILNQQYKSVFSTPSPSNMFEDPKIFFDSDAEDDKLNYFNVNLNLVHEALDKLPPNAAPGPDGLPTLLLKQLKFEIAPALTAAFSKSLENGEIPEAFLVAFIKPIKKPKKPQGDPAAYRPVSLTSNLAKVLEHMIKIQLQKFLENDNVLNPAQHGFRPNRSCISQLLEHYDDVMRNLEEGKICDVIYLDFAKAFDSVDRFILAKELKKLGIQNQAATWLFKFLDGRTQRVIAENEISSPEDVTSGVPQGTVLGPQLFLVIINSLSEEDLKSRISMFADDTRVGFGITTEDDILSLQLDLDKIFNWQKDHNMKFNEDKFELVRHGNHFRNTISIPRGQYWTEDGSQIKLSSSVRDLGIQISEDSDFALQISKVCKDARGKANWIFRMFYSRDVSFLQLMWKVYIQPIMDYGSQIWAPSRQMEIRQLEEVFKNYSSRAQQDNREKFDFWDRIRRYGLRSQQRRAERFRVICIWKILESISPNCGITWTTSEIVGRYCNVFRSPHYSTDKIKTLRSHSFQARGPEIFNSLPFNLRSMTGCSLNTFKNKLDNFLNWIPDTPLAQKYHPIPLDWYSAKPSNSIVDWIKLMGLPTRHSLSAEIIMQRIKNSTAFCDFERERSTSDPRLSENFPSSHILL